MLKFKARLYLGDEIAIGPGKVALIDAIAQTGSISAAARAMGMSYRRAWELVDTLNRCFRMPMIETSMGKGARVTSVGREVADAYRRLVASMEPEPGNLDVAIIQGALRAEPIAAAR